uniref:protein-histidine N-methyltransferase n=1 Tax=Colletotrichum fructicola (strain Nara gc5) TaxID=1213859 RepID=L2G7R8_COLFN
MSSSFSFGFGGDDIEDDSPPAPASAPAGPGPDHTAPPAAAASSSSSAFPVPGKTQLPPTGHDLKHMLAQLPSKVAFSTLDVALDDGTTIAIPRRELHDVKTGVYEGGFKSWESSVDLVKVLASGGYLDALKDRPLRVVELGCGTALPSLAILQWAMRYATERSPLLLTLADYNPSVLQLVTLPNFILAWALERRDQSPAVQEAFALEDELELTPEVLQQFQDFLASSHISLNFISGGWSQELIDLLYESQSKLDQQTHESDNINKDFDTLLIGAETIYSPFALEAFNEMVFAILSKEKAERGGSGCGGSQEAIAEETEGVRRGVVSCTLSSSG